MTVYTEKDYFTESPEYDRHFWNAMKRDVEMTDTLAKGTDKVSGGLYLPAAAEGKFEKAIAKESAFRNLATVIYALIGPTHIFARDCNDLAQWVPSGSAIPVYDGMNDFTRFPVGMHKLAVLVKLDSDFIHDASFNIEDHLTKRLAKNFAKAEDAAFINGGGDHEPVGLLDLDKGASIGVTASTIGFDELIRLFFSLDLEYRKNAVWIMNDETALKLRMLKDDSGNHLWDQSCSSILGRPVVISNDMPSEGHDASPILFGDLSYYWIVCRTRVTLKTLREKFFSLGQVGYLAMEFMDAKLLRREAVKALRIS